MNNATDAFNADEIAGAEPIDHGDHPLPNSNAIMLFFLSASHLNSQLSPTLSADGGL